MKTLLSLFLLFTATTIFITSTATTTTTTTTISPPTSLDRFFKSASTLVSLSSHKPREYFEITHPLPSDYSTPTCTLRIIHHSFANTINKPPFSTPYYPPSDCPSPWSRVILEFRASSKGDQYDRIAGLWLGGAELLRTSTAEPTKHGIFWKVRKDVTRYSSLLKQENLNFTMMLENIVNEVYTGIYHVDVTLCFYKENAIRFPLMGNNYIGIRTPLQQERGVFGDRTVYNPPADLVIPISSSDGHNKGYWFVIERESDIHLKKVKFPNNTRKAILELYVSFHGNDEFWFSNPSNSYIRVNNLTTMRGNGAYREVFVTIDGRVVGSEVPFPVVFTGGINPLFWEPVVAIGAFDLPSYDFDLTPFLGMVLDGKDHEFGIGVTDGISYWLIDANLHIWLDSGLSGVKARSVVYNNPSSFVDFEEEFKMLDGSFRIKARRKMQLVGWVETSVGNLTTKVMQQFKYRNSIKFEKNGTFKYVKQAIKVKKVVRVLNDVGSLLSRVAVKRKYPLKVIIATLPGSKKDTYKLVTNVSHALNARYQNGIFSNSVSNKQDSNGWMEVKDHDVVAGDASTNQTLTYTDELGCYIRIVAAFNGKLIRNDSVYVCPSVM